MNTYRYMIDDGKCVPMTNHWKEVPMHHVKIIEEHSAHMDTDEAGGDASSYAIVCRGKKYEAVPIAQAMHDKFSGRGDLACFYYQEKHEHFGPTGWYHIFE